MNCRKQHHCVLTHTELLSVLAGLNFAAWGDAAHLSGGTAPDEVELVHIDDVRKRLRRQLRECAAREARRTS